VSGDHKFHFTLHFERRSDFDGLSQTGVLMANASLTPGGDPLPVTHHWKRRIGARLVDIPDCHSNMYHASADDIGMDIVCQVEPLGNPSLGSAAGILGPFEVDPITRMNLLNLITSGFSSFPARHCRERNDPHPRDLQIKVTQDCVKVVHPGADRASSEVVATYSADYPKIILHSSDNCKFRLELSEDPEKAYSFQALSRTARDAIALLIRCFHARKYVATSFILSRLFQNPATPGAPLTSVETQDYDISGLGDRLAKELDRTVGQLDVVVKVVRNANMEKSELQAQLRETISSYTEAIEKLHAQLASARGGPTANLQLQLHESRSGQSKLQLELQEMRQQMNDLEQHVPPGGEAGSAKEMESLKSEIQQIRSRISGLAGDQQDQSKRDLTRQEELRRLRADVDMLNSEKDALETNTHHADKEKAELIENFLFVKGCLDDLQMASLSTPAASPEHERHVAQIKAAATQVMEERNRLAQKVDAMDRDREKQKHQREAVLERVMNANARLLEERDRLEKERVRVSQLYERTIGAMGAITQATAGAEDGGAAGDATDDDGPCDQAALDALKAEFEITSEQLSKAEQEGDSLRSRLRRLAMV